LDNNFMKDNGPSVAPGTLPPRWPALVVLGLLAALLGAALLGAAALWLVPPAHTAPQPQERSERVWCAAAGSAR